jgi:hypothetical protein
VGHHSAKQNQKTAYLCFPQTAEMSKYMKCGYTNALEPSGDLLQQFLITIFDKLDRGSSWDDDFELNNLLQVIYVAILLSR